MGVRFLLIGTLPLCLVPSFDCAQAQSAPANSEVLPAIEVVAPATRAKPARRSRGAAQATTRNLRRVFVYPTAPTATAGSGMDVDKVPASVNAVGAGQIARTGSLNIADALQQQVPGIIISDTTGNPFQPDIQFRGFVASPVVGTPQGLAVYQNGVRINEAFGDTVNWDLIPSNAIRSVDLIGSNPIFGLNAIGGALALRMKTGFDSPGARVDISGGSFGRAAVGLEYGKQVDNVAAYLSLEGLSDDGWRNASPSRLRRLYGDIGARGEKATLNLSIGAGSNALGGNGPAPVQLLAGDRRSVFTYPDRTYNRMETLQARGTYELAEAWSLEANAYVRSFRQRTLNA